MYKFSTEVNSHQKYQTKSLSNLSSPIIDIRQKYKADGSKWKKIDALVVFAHSLRYLKDRAIEIIRERTGDEKYNEKDIRWVMTVPAIWRPAAKQFMREAACKVITEKLHKFAFPSLR